MSRIKTLRKSKNYESQIKTIDAELEGKDGYIKRMLIKRKEGIRDNIEQDIVRLLHSVLDDNGIEIGSDDTPVIQLLKDKNIETNLTEIVNIPIRHGNEETNINEIYLYRGDCLIMFEGEKYRELTHNIKLEKILAIYKAMISLINRPLLKSLNEDTTSDYKKILTELERADKNLNDFREKLIDSVEKVVMGIIKKYELPLYADVAKELKGRGIDLKIYIDGENVDISYDIDDDSFYIFDQRGAYHSFLSTMHIEHLIQLYDQLLASLNKNAFKKLNEGLKEDYLESERDINVYRANYTRLQKELSKKYYDLMNMIVKQYDIDLQPEAPISFSIIDKVIEKDEDNGLIELKNKELAAIGDNHHKFILTDLRYCPYEEKFQVSKLYGDTHMVTYPSSMQFDQLYPIYESIIKALNKKPLEKLNESNIKELEEMYLKNLHKGEGDHYEIQKEVQDSLEKLLDMIIDKYDLDLSDQKGLLDELEKKDKDNTLLDLRGRFFNMFETEHTFYFVDILKTETGGYYINIRNEEDSAIKRTKVSFTGFHFLYPIYTALISTINKEAFRSMNERVLSRESFLIRESFIQEVEEYQNKVKEIEGKISDMKRKKEELDEKYKGSKDKIEGHIVDICEYIKKELIEFNQDLHIYLEDDQGKMGDIMAALGISSGAYMFVDHGDVMFDIEGDDTYDITEYNVDKLFEVLKILISIPKVSAYYNKDMFKKLNELYDNDVADTKSEYLIKANKLLNGVITSYNLIEEGEDNVSLKEKLQEKGIDINLSDIYLYDQARVQDIIAKKAPSGYSFLLKCIESKTGDVFEIELGQVVRRKTMVRIFNTLSKAINAFFLKQLNA